MKIIRTIAMNTDHSYHGVPLEAARVTLHCSEQLTQDEIEIAKNNLIMKLHSMAKRMPHAYWLNQPPRAAQGE